MRIDDQILANYHDARHSFLAGDVATADCFYGINRRLGVDLYYEVELPEHLLLVHPIGTVLGRATYGDYFVAYHGCGVGSTIDGERPVIGEGVVLFPGAKVLGDTRIGNNVFITANTVVQGVVVPDNSIVYSGWMGPQDDPFVTAYWKPTTRSVKERFFKS